MLDKNIAEKIDKFLDEQGENLIEFTSNLIKAKSVNPPGDEREVAEVASKEFIKLGLTPDLWDHGENYRSVIATIGENKGKPAIVLNGHLDTVPPGEVKWDRDPFSGDIEEGILYGRGASDMKAGDAAMTYATAALKAAGLDLKGELRLALTSSEETVSIGANAVAESSLVEGVGAVLISEPSNLDIYTSEKGCFWLKVTAKGKTAHGSMPHCGVNAIDGLCTFLDKLRGKWQGLADSPHPELGPTTASINTITGGVGTNVIPDLAQSNIDIRTIPGQDHQEILKEMQLWISDIILERPGLSIEIEILNDRAPYEIADDHDTIEIMAKSVKEVTGKDPIRKGVAFYTDASIFGPKCNLPVVIFGPGDPTLAHQPNEKVSTQSIIEASKAIAHWAAAQLV